MGKAERAEEESEKRKANNLKLIYPTFVIIMGVGYSTCKLSRGKEAWSFA
jgi:hypothetical protein